MASDPWVAVKVRLIMFRFVSEHCLRRTLRLFHYLDYSQACSPAVLPISDHRQINFFPNMIVTSLPSSLFTLLGMPPPGMPFDAMMARGFPPLLGREPDPQSPEKRSDEESEASEEDRPRRRRDKDRDRHRDRERDSERRDRWELKKLMRELRNCTLVCWLWFYTCYSTYIIKSYFIVLLIIRISLRYSTRITTHNLLFSCCSSCVSCNYSKKTPSSWWALYSK